MTAVAKHKLRCALPAVCRSTPTDPPLLLRHGKLVELIKVYAQMMYGQLAQANICLMYLQFTLSSVEVVVYPHSFWALSQGRFAVLLLTAFPLSVAMF
jgi:hypothetical protein